MKDLSEKNFAVNQNERCPCKRTCIRHGNCEACKAHHQRESRYLPCCMRKGSKSGKVKPNPASK